MCEFIHMGVCMYNDSFSTFLLQDFITITNRYRLLLFTKNTYRNTNREKI